MVFYLDELCVVGHLTSSSHSSCVLCGCWTKETLGKPDPTSQGLSAWLQRPWQTSLNWTFFTWWWNDTLSQSQLLPSVYQWCIQHAVDVHEALTSWPAFLESQGMMGGCQPIMLPLSCTVTGCKVALSKYEELIHYWQGQCQKVFSSGQFCWVSAAMCQDPGLWGWGKPLPLQTSGSSITHYYVKLCLLLSVSVSVSASAYVSA